MESDFPSNSRDQRKQESSIPKGEEKNIEKVVTGAVVQRKRSLGKRFKTMFFAGPDIKSVMGQVWSDTIIPMSKDLIFTAGESLLRHKLFGEAPYRGPSGRPRGVRYDQIRSATHVSPNRSAMYREEINPPHAMSRRGRANFDFGEIILETRVEAMEVIDQLYALLSRYPQVTVADLYDMLGQDSNYIERDWGWTDLSGADVVRVRDGYLLDLPRPEPID